MNIQLNMKNNGFMDKFQSKKAKRKFNLESVVNNCRNSIMFQKSYNSQQKFYYVEEFKKKSRQNLNHR